MCWCRLLFSTLFVALAKCEIIHESGVSMVLTRNRINEINNFAERTLKEELVAFAARGQDALSTRPSVTNDIENIRHDLEVIAPSVECNITTRKLWNQCRQGLIRRCKEQRQIRFRSSTRKNEEFCEGLEALFPNSTAPSVPISHQMPRILQWFDDEVLRMNETASTQVTNSRVRRNAKAWLWRRRGGRRPPRNRGERGRGRQHRTEGHILPPHLRPTRFLPPPQYHPQRHPPPHRRYPWFHPPPPPRHHPPPPLHNGYPWFWTTTTTTTMTPTTTTRITTTTAAVTTTDGGPDCGTEQNPKRCLEIAGITGKCKDELAKACLKYFETRRRIKDQLDDVFSRYPHHLNGWASHLGIYQRAILIESVTIANSGAGDVFVRAKLFDKVDLDFRVPASGFGSDKGKLGKAIGKLAIQSYDAYVRGHL